MSKKLIVTVSLVVFLFVFIVICIFGSSVFRFGFEDSQLDHFLLRQEYNMHETLSDFDSESDEEEIESEETENGRVNDRVIDTSSAECVSLSGKTMTFGEAQEISESSSCAEEGGILDAGSCNVDTGTWWVNMEADKENCFPACVVDLESGEAEINWRCAGLIVDQE